MADQLGRRLGNYTLIRHLGKGGFAEVYLGEHVYLKSLAAIKVLKTQLSRDDVSRFVSEARLLVGLRHPHIVRVLEFGVEDDTPFLVMDYAPHGTLRQRYPKGTRLAPAVVATYVRQVASALQYAHNQKLIHRDVKPENLLFHDNDEVLLSDFGVALIAQTTRQSTQGVIGTATYMAPEQIQGKATIASDQYSLGIVAYEWLSGLSPFQGSFSEVCAQHVLTPPTPLHETIPMLLPAIENVVLTALAKEPGKRFPNVEAFAIALERVCQPDQMTQTGLMYPQADFSTSPLSSDQEATFVRLPPDVTSQQAYPHPMMARDLTRDKSPNPTTKEFFTLNTPEDRSSVANEPGNFVAPDNGRNFVAQPIRQRTVQRRPFSRGFMALLIVLVIALVGSLGLLFSSLSSSHQPTASGPSTNQVQPTPTPVPQPTPTAAPQPTPTTAPQQTKPSGGTLALNDSLSGQSANKWDMFTYANNVGGCSYVNGAYHATIKQAGSFSVCKAQATKFSNFTYQVRMTILSGTNKDGGGLIFRATSGKAYRFRVSTDGSFDLVDDAQALVNNTSPAIRTGLNQTNVLQVKAQGSSISLYINTVLLTQITDSFSSAGAIGVFAVDFTQPTDVAFSRAQVWQ